ncbi:MAG TPA: SRPBCC family protein, partial [Dehalococcoidia bacterium]|nr:SRPBCC family protein [Dehalococcoidia bacterium]
MAKLHGTIDIEAPVSLAYSQWLQLEQLPDCMPGLRVVLELDQEHSYWIAESWGRRKEWFAQTVRQIPDQYIAWRSDDGLPIAGSVSFINLGPRQTRVSVQVEYQPEGKLEK